VTAPETILALVRPSFYAAATVLFGVECFVAILAPVPLGKRLATTAGGGLKAVSLVALLACIASLPATAAVVGGDWDAALDGPALKILLLATSVGHALLLRAGLALIVMILLLARAGSPRLKITGSALPLASLSLSGHARMNAGGREAFHIANHVVHLLSGGFWLGSLAFLPACLALLRDPVLGADAKVALRRFSSWGHVAVALVILTGIVNAVLILDGWPGLQTPYQWLLLMKVALVAAMAGAAFVNRYRFVPRLRTGPDAAVRNIPRGTYLELALGVAVMAVVAVLGMIEPS